MARSLLTWSVIDLSKIDRIVETAEQLFQTMGDLLRDYPELIRYYTQCIYSAEEYGDGNQNMRDLGSVVYNRGAIFYSDASIMDRIMSALEDAVVYVVRGPGRSAARGLSFCYPADFSDKDLTTYAENYPMPSYLAYLDAISDWTAPDWVYEQVERLPSIDTIDALKINVEKTFSGGGMPALSFGSSIVVVYDAYYCLYQLDEKTGEVVRLGRTDCGFEQTEDGRILWRASDPMHWPVIDGTLCCIDLVQIGSGIRLYNIPVQINSDTAILRCGRTIYTDEGEKRLSSYEIYGVWVGYDENSEMVNRSVTPLALMAGREYRLLYPKDGTDSNGNTLYAKSTVKKMYRALEVEEIPLPAGTYYLEYELDDVFLRKKRLERIEIHWDGKEMTFPEDFSWEGSFQVEWD